MIDLDAIKAAGLNSHANSMRLMAMHEHRQRIELHNELMARFLRDHPDISPADLDAYQCIATMECGL